MNKRKIPIIIIVLLLLTCFAYWYFRYIYGWMEFRKNTDTPKEFLNHVLIKEDDYTKDSLEIVKQLRSLLFEHKDFFYSKEYSDDTELIIDSILYSPDFNKLAVFVITKNSTYGQSMPNKNSKWYYDGTCYLGIRENGAIVLSWIGPVFTNSSNEQSISKDIRDACLRTFATKDTSDVYAYNLNDIRFWDSAIWGKIKDDKIRRREFEEEKRNHPENVYEPKK